VGAVADAFPSGNAHATAGTPSKLDEVVSRTQAKDALVGLGWKPTIAQAAVAAASAMLGTNSTLEQLIFEALRRCRHPTA
jgi:Holliday junction resolvasome RuvABC DNA-binding subunit